MRLRADYLCRGRRRSADEILSRILSMHVESVRERGRYLDPEEVSEARRRLKFQGCGARLNDEMDRLSDTGRLLVFRCPRCKTEHVIHRTED